ncbi:MAG: site-2 protease family protein [Oscillospiraceae bacterium]|nr:site-2 protease family protein [Oscillospiraceae bacterium]
MLNNGILERLNPLHLLVMAIVVVTCLPIHELAHGLAADRLGDHTARACGRLTLNPLAHLNLFGTLALFLFGFGWANPVPVDVGNFKHKKRDMALTAAAGPGANLALSAALMLLYKVLLYTPLNTVSYNGYVIRDAVVWWAVYVPEQGAGLTMGNLLLYILVTIISTSIYLALFNLLPIPPLDGSRILECFLPWKVAAKLARYQNVIYIVMILLLYFGILTIPVSYGGYYLFRALDWLTRPVELLLQLLTR